MIQFILLHLFHLLLNDRAPSVFNDRAPSVFNVRAPRNVFISILSI